MRVCCIAVAAWAMAVSAVAQEPLTVRAAIAEALNANPELVALRLQFEAARALPGQERFLAAPMFEAQVWGWPVTTLDPTRTDMYMFMAGQEIPGRGKRAARVLVGDREADVERHRIAVRANEIVDEIRQAFAGIAVGRASLAVVDEQAAILRDIADAATVRYAAGHSGQHDTVKALVELVRLDRERIDWRGHVRESEARLNTMLGRPADAPVEPLAAAAPATVPAEALRLASERHPALIVARAEIAREEAELERLRTERRPDFVVGGGYMLQPGGAGAWTARAGLSWPDAPWSRGRIDAAIDAQEKRLTAARARLEAERTIVTRGVQEAIVRLEAAQARIALLEQTVLPHVEHAMDVARVAYTSDRGAFADLLDSQRVLVATRLDVIAARADAERASADLERALGVAAGVEEGQ